MVSTTGSIGLILLITTASYYTYNKTMFYQTVPEENRY